MVILDDPAVLTAGMNAHQMANGQSNITSGIELAHDELLTSRSQIADVIVIITDGYQNRGLEDFLGVIPPPEAADNARADGI